LARGRDNSSRPSLCGSDQPANFPLDLIVHFFVVAAQRHHDGREQTAITWAAPA
jgi:hypothetical protein